ncbi:MAG: hypothetical protein ABFQ95_02825 [Pseudomonadota bacterium]
MDSKIRFLWGMFLCLLFFQVTVILSYAHSADKDRSEISTDMPEVKMGEPIVPKENGTGMKWDNAELLKLRNEFEAKLLPDLKSKAARGDILEGTMWNYIKNKFLQNGVSEEEAKEVARMMNFRIDWLATHVTNELRGVPSTSNKYAKVAGNPYRNRPYSELAIPGGDLGQWGPVSDYEAQRVYLRLMAVSNE